MQSEPERSGEARNPFTPISAGERLTAARRSERHASRPVLAPGMRYGANESGEYAPQEAVPADLPVQDARARYDGLPDYLRDRPAARHSARTDRYVAPPFTANAIPGLNPWESPSRQPEEPSGGATVPYDPQALSQQSPMDGFYSFEEDAPEPEAESVAPYWEPSAFSGAYEPVETTEAPYAADEPAEVPEEPPQAQPGLAKRARDRLDQATEKPAARVNARLRAINPWRLATLIGCSVALLFCALEGGKMVYSLWRNEQEMRNVRAAYLEREGKSLEQSASRVELLPAGQTFVPTATPVAAAATPTPSPRIAQNDPLIGVVDGGGQTTFAAALPTPTVATRTKQAQYSDNPWLTEDADFDELRADNGDVVGRLVIDGVLDETVVMRNNTYYLTHNARGSYGQIGAIFVDESCSLRKPPENLILRGQAAYAGKLFAPLSRYGEESFARAHAVIRMDTIYERGEYEVFAVVHASSRTDSPHYFNFAGYATFQSDAQMLGYVASAKARSVVAFDAEPTAADRLLTLAALSESDQCWVVLAYKR